MTILKIKDDDGNWVDVPCLTGNPGAPGAQGEPGTPFTYDMFTAAQLAALKGADGYTPVRGTDYWTAADIASIKAYVDDVILGGEW